MSSPNSILVLFAHPVLEKSRINRSLLQSIRGLDAVTIHDLYETYPDFHINVKHEQELLVSHNIIVFQHPFYWYSSPALLKEWQDLVLEHGFAYGREGVALKGRKLLSVISTGGGEASYSRTGYNYFSLREFLTPFQQTAQLCGMEYLPPFVVHGTHELREPQQIQQYAQEYHRSIVSLRDNLIDWDKLHTCQYFNQALDQII